MIGERHTLCSNSGYYKTRLMGYIGTMPVWITKPVDVLDIQVNYEVIEQKGVSKHDYQRISERSAEHGKQ